MRIPPLSIIFIAIILVSSTLANTTLSITNSGVVTMNGPPPGLWFDYIVVIMMENHSINLTYDNGHVANPCFGNCTYFTSLANANGLAENYTNMGVQDGSVYDYLAMTSGYNGLNMHQDCNDGVRDPNHSGGCDPIDVANIVDRLENANLTWKAYMEGYPAASGCPTTPSSQNVDDFHGSTNYGPNHNPFIYYQDVRNNTARCSLIVRANSNVSQQTDCSVSAVKTDDVFLNDLQSPLTTPNYMFLTPNTVNDLHDCNMVDVGNAWLAKNVPLILNSGLFQTRRAALFVTFDEQGCTNPPGQPLCPSAAPQIYSVWASNPSSANPTTKVLKSIVSYNHFSALSTVEANWKLPPLVASSDGKANPMQEFFKT